MVRLYVRGLPDSNTSIQDVVARFASFGQVEACELVPRKQPETAGISKPSLVARPPWGATPVANCRFAYVEMEPKDDSSLARCLSVSRMQLEASETKMCCPSSSLHTYLSLMASSFTELFLQHYRFSAI
eukprot:1158699-Pelagomonas_calceolata.AAC.9